MHLLLWISIAALLYTYLGYPLLLRAGILVRRAFGQVPVHPQLSHTPSLTVVVAACNEEACIEEKILNTLSLDYPAQQLHFIFVTDGSADGTPQIVARYPQIQLMHAAERRGKVAAINRAMTKVSTGIVVFTDANTLLNKEALLYLAQWYSDERVGAVAGEKHVSIPLAANAAAGEGVYWKYESMLKQSESELVTVAGAAGELFSIRTALYTPLADDTILDDLMISMQIAIGGHRICYERRAVATERPSPSVKEETKRKRRIAAGDIQAMMRIPFFTMLINRPGLWFAYTSHRIFRWIIAPYALATAFITNAILVYNAEAGRAAGVLMYMQISFYCLALLGFFLRNAHMRGGFFFIPYYFCLMHYNLVAGTIRYWLKGQEVRWEKAERVR